MRNREKIRLKKGAKESKGKEEFVNTARAAQIAGMAQRTIQHGIETRNIAAVPIGRRHQAQENDEGPLTIWAKKDGLVYRMLSAGVWETTFKLTTDEASYERQFRLLGMLGFGVYLLIVTGIGAGPAEVF